jgi:CHAT domain-containing protein
MCPARKIKRGIGQGIARLRNKGYFLFFLLALTLLSCARKQDPQAVFDHATETLKRGDLAKAAVEAERGYNDFRTSSAEWAWKFTLLRAKALYRQGSYEDVLRILSAEPTIAPSSELAIRRRWLEALSLTSLGNIAQAEKKLDEAENTCGNSPSAVCGDVLTARGTLEMKRGLYERAQAFFERVLTYARTSGNKSWEADALLDMSWSALEQTHYDQALDWASAVRTISIARNSPDLAQAALGNMGWAYYKLGDTEKAKEAFRDAEQQAEKLGDTADELRWLLNLGYVYSDNGDLSATEQSYRQSLNLARKLNSREDIINAEQALAFVSEQNGKLDDAKRYADEALSMARADGNKRDETYPRLVQGRVAAHEHDLATAEAAFHEVEQSSDSPVFLKWEAEHFLARLYEDENQTDAAAHEYCTALSTFESARSELQHEDSRLPFLTNASGIYDDYIHFLVSKGKTAEALQAAEYQRGRTLAEGLGLLKTDSSKTGTSKKDSLQKGIACKPEQLNPQAIARRAGGAILFYSLGEKQSYLWTITTQKTNLFVLPAKSEIDPTIQRYRKDLAEQQEFLPRAGADGRTLYRMLVAPAQSMLAKEGKVFVIPDGSLNTLNFETLVVGDAGDPASHYWIDDATIADASSLHMLAAASTSSKRNNNLLLLGNAIAASADYPELRQASAEMESIEKHFAEDQQQVFNREQATPTAYLASKPDQFSYIHFVAHGTASRVSPLDSAIVLSSASKQDDSFKLYARDIIHQPLHARLVTISTCYGAGARAYSGEGLVGLSWAFLRAGAHNVIGALWEVSDNSTPQLMDTLYDGLQKGQNPDAALRAAKLSLLHSKNTFSKPFYWAPFQLYTRS